MPQVPTYGSQNVLPSPGQAPQVQDAYQSGAIRLAKMVGAEQGQPAQAAGAALSRTGDDLANIANDAALEANAVRLGDAQNQAINFRNSITTNNQQTGYQDLKGQDALPQGKALSQVYGDQLQQKYNDISNGLTNDAQKLAFQKWAQDDVTQFKGAVDRHSAQQFDVYRDSMFDGEISNGADTIARNADNPDLIEQGIKGVYGATLAKANGAGLAPNDGEELARQHVSKALIPVVKNMLDQGNYSAAQAFTDKYKNQITGDDLLTLHTILKGEQELGTAQAAVSSAASTVGQNFNPTTYAKMIKITAQSESGGHETNADGTTVTSAKGAQGIMQVMPATAANPGYGVRPAQDNSAAERARVGRDFLPAMIQHYAGDPAKAWAAYNWGPGNIDKTIKQFGDDWLQHTPAETQKYVSGNMAQLSSTAIAAPTKVDYVNAALGKLPQGASPTLVQKTQQLAEQKFELDHQADQEQKLNNYNSAMSMMMDGNKQFNDLPASVRASVPPDKIPELMEFGKKLNNVETDPALYTLLSTPGALSKMSDAQWVSLRPQLSKQDFDMFTKERVNQLNPTKNSNDPGSLDRESFSSLLNSRLAQLGINTKVKPGTEDAAHLGAVQKAVSDYVISQQIQAQRRFDYAGLSKTIDHWMLHTAPTQPNLFGFAIGAPQQKRLAQIDVNDISNDDMTKIKAALARQGNTTPTRGDILGVYYRAHQ